MTASTADQADVGSAYRHCEQVTRTQARNFSYGIALLPGAKRRALSAVYAFARRIDDVGDGTMPAGDKLTALRHARVRIEALQSGAAPPPDDPVLVALADAARRFAIPLGAFGELVDGCEADVRGTSYGTFGELEHYCRCVAGSIGRLSLGVFGSRDPATAQPLADALGVALQLTNILRDIREDLGTGRVYLPAEDLTRFGCALAARGVSGDGGVSGGGVSGDGGVSGGGVSGDGGVSADGGARGGGVLAESADMAELVRFEAQRALGWYSTGLRLLPLLDRRSAASAGAMAGIYLRLLQQIAAAPQDALRQRASLSTRGKAMVAARALAGMARRGPAFAVPEVPSPAGAAGAGTPGARP